MSQTHRAATSSSKFQQIFDNALKEYQRRTKKDLLNHPLAAQLEPCDSPDSIRAVLRQQVQELNRSQNTDDPLTKWLDPMVHVLCSLSDVLGQGVSPVCSTT
jgi:fungal STAND N-terminal Goodbye domain